VKNITAFFAGFLAIVLIAKAMGAEMPAYTLQWRALAFSYINGKYQQALDMFDRDFPDQLSCMAAAHQGVDAMRLSMKKGEGIVALCVQLPNFDKVPVT
jgi:hypothetical protein